MPLDHTLADLLSTMATDQSYVRPTETDLTGARRSHEADAARFTPPARRAAVASVRQVELSHDEAAPTVRIYRPEAEPVPLPTIVWYHGGGWTTGSLETGDILARRLCAGAQAVVASVSYRLAPEHPWPAAADDATLALKWVAENIDQLGGDEGCIAVGGDSAGGNLAAVVAQTAPDLGAPLAGQILLYPFLDLDMNTAATRYPSLEENARGYYVTLADLHWCVGNYLPPGADPTDPRISPALHPDLSGLPAAVIAVAEYDPLRDQGLVYADALRASSVSVTLHQGRGLIHGYCDMVGVVPAARTELENVVQSVRDALASRVADTLVDQT
jgi:acetyl esterase